MLEIHQVWHCNLLQLTHSVSGFVLQWYLGMRGPVWPPNYIYILTISVFNVKVHMALSSLFFFKNITQIILIWSFILWYFFSGNSPEFSAVSVAHYLFNPPGYSVSLSQGPFCLLGLIKLDVKHFKLPSILTFAQQYHFVSLSFWPILQHIPIKKRHPQGSTEQLKRIKWDLFDKLEFLRNGPHLLNFQIHCHKLSWFFLPSYFSQY